MKFLLFSGKKSGSAGLRMLRQV